MHTDEHTSGSTPIFGYPAAEFSEAPFAVARVTRPVLAVLTTPRNFSYAVIKRLVDVVLVALFAPVWVPLCLGLALCVVITSPGPVFFSHRRIGRGGVFFSMWKFRTMCVDSAEVLEQHLAKHPEVRREWAANHKLKKDPRITALGRMLRRSSMDELPQLWNVLRGDMTLVGPRPIVAAEAEMYGSDFAYYLAVKPGITGLWQTSGRSTLSYDARVALDRRYVEEWSLPMDARILAMTITKVMNADGAY
jgi:exopolysaccharide production protein ExoY